MTVAISSESTPAGGTVEIKAYLFAPAALASGELSFRLDPAVFGTVGGVAIFSAAGDGCGFAHIANGVVDIHFASATGTIGSVVGLPILAFTVPVLAGASNGTTAIAADATGSTWKGAGGAAVSVAVTAGSVTVGGSTLWISGVSPAVGALAAGTTVKISGGGFDGGSFVEAPGISIASTKYASPSELDFTLGAAADLGGKRITIRNLNGAKVDFFTVTQVGSALLASDHPDLFDGSVPIFPTAAYKSALSSYLGNGLGGYGGRILLRNPGPAAVNVIMRSMLMGSKYAGQQYTATLAPGGTYTLSTFTFPHGEGYDLRVLADGPLQMMELFEDYDYSTPEPAFTEVQALTPASAPPVELTTSPEALSWTWQTGTAAPLSQTVGVYSSNSVPTQAFTMSFTTASGGQWLSVAPSGGTACYNCTTLTASVNPSSLAPGVYRGSITVTPVADSLSTNVIPSTIPVALTVVATPPVNYIVGHGANFTFTSSAAPPQSNTWDITPAMLAGSLTVDVTLNSGAGWLTATPASGVSPAGVAIAVNPASLSPGTYAGLVNIHGPGGAFLIPVTAAVSGGIELVADKMQLDFTVTSAGIAPAFATVSVGPACGGQSSCTASWGTPGVSTASGGNWLTAAAGGAGLAVSVNPANLPAGLYAGVITLTSTTAGQLQIPVTLTVAGTSPLPALVVNPPSVEFPNGASFLGVSTGYQSAPLTVTTSTTDGGTWLSTVAYGSTTPVDLQIGADMSGLPGGVYHGVVTVAVPGQSVDIPVTATVSAYSQFDPTPSMASVVSAASGAAGSIAPGEIVSIHGLALGPATPEGFEWTSQGRVPTNLMAVQVLIDGKPAPILYASSQQINAIVPFEVSGESTATVQVTTGAAGGAWGIPVVAAQPAIFTSNGTGAGQGAILNQDNSYNGAGNPAARGSVVQIFATGIAFPSQTTGAPNFPNNVPSAVAVTIGGYNAAVQYAGPAPGAVAGLVQINAVVPAGVTPGSSVPIQISASSFLSPSGVTVAVQ